MLSSEYLETSKNFLMSFPRAPGGNPFIYLVLLIGFPTKAFGNDIRKFFESFYLFHDQRWSADFSENKCV